MQVQKQKWESPRLVVHGTVAAITLQYKVKDWGGADDVLVAQQQILRDAS